MYKNIATYKTKNTKTPFCREREKPLRLRAPPYWERIPALIAATQSMLVFIPSHRSHHSTVSNVADWKISSSLQSNRWQCGGGLSLLNGDLMLRCHLVGETQCYKVHKQCPHLLLSQWAYHTYATLVGPYDFRDAENADRSTEPSHKNGIYCKTQIYTESVIFFDE